MMSRNTMMMTTLVKTLSVRCQDAQCYVTDQGCSQLPNQMTSFLCGHKARQMPSSQAHNTILVIESKCHRKHIAINLVIEWGRFHKQNTLSSTLSNRIQYHQDHRCCQKHKVCLNHWRLLFSPAYFGWYPRQGFKYCFFTLFQAETPFLGPCEWMIPEVRLVNFLLTPHSGKVLGEKKSAKGGGEKSANHDLKPSLRDRWLH